MTPISLTTSPMEKKETMTENSKRKIFLKVARVGLVAYFVLFALWQLPPLIHGLRHLCPLRSDGIQETLAVPSFARQTGFACEVCHTVFPELTPFGRRFKLNGYTLTTKPADVSDTSVTSSTEAAKRNLTLSYVSPLSYDVQIAYSKYNVAPPDKNAGTKGGPPAGAQTAGDAFLFPEQISLYYAGRVTDDIGTWIQMTYSQPAGSLGIDNTELRYTHHSADRKWLWGTFANNTPGMEDVYNTALSAFGVPMFNVPSLYNFGAGSSAASGGLRGPLYQSGTFTNSAGGGEYLWYNDSLYVEFAGYHSGVPGTIATGNTALNATGALGAISGVAPKARVSYEEDWGRNALEVGAMAMDTEFVPPAIGVASMNSPTTANQYMDTGFDWQYQYIGDENIVSFIGSGVNERQSNNPLFVESGLYSNAIDNLYQTSLTAEYYYKRKYGALVNFVNTTGTKDALMNGANGAPNNQYWVFELDYMPWLNTKFILQYDAYTIVDGNQSPFYGTPAASKASANNTLVLGLWMDF